MEILLKAKQANNPQFSFLSIGEPLHPYYKFVLEAIKTGKYNPEKQPEKEESGMHTIFYKAASCSNIIKVDIIELK